MGVKSRAGNFRDDKFRGGTFHDGSSTTAMASYVRCYENFLPPPRELVQRMNDKGGFPPTGEKALHTLAVCAALYQDISEKILAGTVEQLLLSLGDAFYRPHDISFSGLEEKVSEACRGYPWDLAPKVPGILRSLQDFSKAVGGWETWLDRSTTGEAMVRSLCADVFYMGKHSEHPFKARYLVMLWAGIFPEKASDWLREFCFPLSRGAVRYLRDAGRLPQRDYDKGVATRILGELYAQMGLKHPMAFYYALACYRQRMDLQRYRCQEVMGGCGKCPLEAACPK